MISSLALAIKNLVRPVISLTLIFCLSAWLSSGPSAAPSTPPVIWSSKSQSWVAYEDFVIALRRTDLIFLGELHDNPEHHQHRARLLVDLNRTNLHVVFEQLPSQASFLIPGKGSNLLGHLRTKGFNDKAWQWPLHEPLFSAAQRLGIWVTGGNLAPSQGRRFYSDGLNAVPRNIKLILDKAPLSAIALAELDTALIEGHCGHLPERLLPVMRLVQQSTDISMVLSAVASLPAVVIAGNGHVQKNFGMPHYVSYLRPASNVASVGFLESPLVEAYITDTQAVALAAIPPPALREQQAFDFVWMTSKIDREDPCKALINFKQR